MNRTILTQPSLLIFALLLCLPCVRAHGQEAIPVAFEVRVPDDTPADATISICGNVAALGAWQPPGLVLERGEDGVYRASAELTPNARVEFKVTRGSWSTVEKDRAGGEVDNRAFFVTAETTTVTAQVESWATTEAANATSSITGTVIHHAAFPSTNLGRARDIFVWLPPGYDDTRSDGYPVLYMHDGQNLFDEARAFRGREWNADEAATALINDGRIPPLIIVGISNTSARMTEYTPVADTRYRGASRPEGAAYGRFIVEELKPFIDTTYRTNPDRDATGVAGSSLGGLISLYLTMAHPDVFSRCGVISPALSWGDGWILTRAERPDAIKWMKDARFWVDMGTMEFRRGEDGLNHVTSAIQSTRRLVDAFDARGMVPGRDYYYAEVAGGEHNESAWSARFESILLYFYGW